MFSRVLGAAGRLLIIAGVVILGFVAYQLWGTGIEEAHHQDELLSEYAQSIGAPAEADLAAVAAASPASESATTDTTDTTAAATPTEPAGEPPSPEPGQPVGVIEIPRIDLARVVVEGTSRPDLKKGPGHYIGTPFPGQKGNVGIAGHRTTYGAPFNRIDELAPGDDIVLSTSQGRFNYKVIPAPGATNQAWYTVSPREVEVLRDMGDNRVTLTACHPKRSARQRIIVHALLQQPPVPPSPTPAHLTEPGETTAAVAKDFDQGLGSTPEELPVALTYGGVAALVGLGAWLLARNIKQWWVVWLIASPIILVVIWNGYVHMDRYLPAF